MSMEAIFIKGNLETGNMKEKEFIILMRMMRREGIDMKEILGMGKRMEKEFIIRVMMIDMKGTGKRI